MTDDTPLTRQDVKELIYEIVPGIVRDIVTPIVTGSVHPLEVRLDRQETEFHEFRDATLTRLDHLIGLYERSDQERTLTNATLEDHESRIEALEERKL